jgi:hypothetical protein
VRQVPEVAVDTVVSGAGRAQVETAGDKQTLKGAHGATLGALGELGKRGH